MADGTAGPSLACVWWPGASAGERTRLAERLRHFSPYVEADARAPGLFFVDATGLMALFPSQAAWAEALLADCRAQAEPVHVQVGFHRLALWALVRAAAAGHVRASRHATPARERAALDAVPVATLGLPEATLRAAERLRLWRLRDCWPLGALHLHAHVGPALADWLRGLSVPAPPLSRAVPLPPAVVAHDLEWPSDDHVRLLFLTKPLLASLMEEAAVRRQHVAAVHVLCRYQGGANDAPPPLVRRLERPTGSREAADWWTPLRLWFEHAPWAAAVRSIALRAELSAPARPEQLPLWPERPVHERQAMQEALSKVQSAWGEQAVTTATLVSAHLPEHRFAWRPWRGQALPQALPVAARGADPEQLGRLPRVRLMWPEPRPLASPWVQVLRGRALPPGAWWRGPFRFNVDWWRANAVDRDYCYVGRPREAPLLAYYDRRRRRWWAQGMVD